MAVTSIDDASFEQQVSANNRLIVKYYADWCGTCKLFAPKFKRLSNDERFKDVTFVEVDAEKNPETRKKGLVKNLPTFAVFKDGKLINSVPTNKEDAVVELLQQLA